tara:strand:+ start:54 stop:248 length:195 start_codon:yes stop_codon:yes gene_type:complete
VVEEETVGRLEALVVQVILLVRLEVMEQVVVEEASTMLEQMVRVETVVISIASIYYVLLQSSQE